MYVQIPAVDFDVSIQEMEFISNSTVRTTVPSLF